MDETPILDLKQDPPAPRSTRLRRWIGLAIGAAIGGLLAYLNRDEPASLNGLLILPALYVVVTVHELGHLLAGWMVGMKPGGLVVGGFSVVKSGRSYSFRFDWRRIIGGGMAVPLTAKNQFSIRQFAWMVAGGPLASLLLTIVCGSLSVLRSDYSGGWLNVLFWMALLTLSSLIPASAGVNKSDGARLQDLLQHPERVQPWIALVAMQSEEKRGVRPRDWDPELVETVLATPPAAREYPYSELMMFYRAADRGEEEPACKHLENALAASAQSGKLIRHCFFLEASAVVALVRKDARGAKIWFERARKLRKPVAGDSVEATIAICEGRFEDAIPRLTAAGDLIRRRKLDSGLARFALEKIDERLALCRTAKLAAPAI